MDDTDFVSAFCIRLAEMDRQTRLLFAYYVFSDKRPGSVIERFRADAKEFDEHRRLFRP